MTRLARGQLLGWAAVGVVDAVVLDLKSRPQRAGLAVRAFQHAYDGGHVLAAGLLSAAAILAWQRWAPNRHVRGWAGLAAASLALGAVVLPEDLSGVASRMPGPHALWGVVTVALVALAIPILAQVTVALVDDGGSGRRGADLGPQPPVERPPRARGNLLRGLVALGGVVIAVTNHFVLQNDYDGLHLFASWAAAIMLGVAAAVDVARSLSPRVRLALITAAVAVAACSAIVKPRNEVAIELRRETGGSLATWVLRARRSGARIVPHVQNEWFVDRSDLPPVAPSSPPLLPPEGPIVVVITIDALRADVVVGPEHDALLPSIAALKRESVMFTDARSTAPGTSASLAAFFTGKYFSELYWTPIPGNPLVCPHDDHSVRFPEILAGRGAATVTFASLSGMLNDTGIARGFTEETFVPGKGGWATASMVDEQLLPRLRRQGPGPLFLYVHYDDAHAPYNSTGPQGTEYERYLREVATVDVEIGRIRGVLAERGLDQRAAFILSADHGEAFGEHGTRYHATTVYDELLHVPLLIHVPGVAPRVVTTTVSLIDVGPTVLDLMGASTPAVFMGQSLTPFLRGQSPVLTRPLVAEASRGMRAMMFADGIKVIHNPRVGLHEVYDLAADPGELHDLTTARAAMATQRQDVLDAFIAAHELKRPGYVTPFVR